MGNRLGGNAGRGPCSTEICDAFGNLGGRGSALSSLMRFFPNTLKFFVRYAIAFLQNATLELDNATQTNNIKRNVESCKHLYLFTSFQHLKFGKRESTRAVHNDTPMFSYTVRPPIMRHAQASKRRSMHDYPDCGVSHTSQPRQSAADICLCGCLTRSTNDAILAVQIEDGDTVGVFRRESQ